jgi:uncharacterized RDD family membrane protein YckC
VWSYAIGGGGALERQSPTLRGSVLTLRPAGFWIRLLAALIDLLILAIPLIVFVSFFSVATGSWRGFLDLHPGETPAEITEKFGRHFLVVVLLFFLVMEWLYFAILESSMSRATFGKRALGLYVGDARGNRVGFVQASSRFFCGRLLMHVPYVGLYYFCVDCLWIGIFPGKRAIHDIISGCRVFRDDDGEQTGTR